jgi:hypothetical protein
MKAKLGVLFSLLMCFSGYSQFEMPKKTLKIAPISNPKGQISPTSSTSNAVKYPSIFDKKDKLLGSFTLLSEKPEETKSILEPEKFESQSKEYTDKMNKGLKAEGLTSVVENRDFFFGEYTVTTGKIIISCRDFGAIDGDYVSIWLNGEKVIPSIYLESGYKKYTFTIKEGLNTVFIEALNTGLYYPNTGQFSFLDGNEKLVTDQKWTLNSGYKAIVKIRKIDELKKVDEIIENKKDDN